MLLFRHDFGSHGSVRYIYGLDDLSVVLLKAEGEVKVDESDLDDPLPNCLLLVGKFNDRLFACFDSDVVEAYISMNNLHLVEKLDPFGQLVKNFENVNDVVILRGR